MVEYNMYKFIRVYEVPDIKIPSKDIIIDIGSSHIESMKIKSIENLICESKIFKCVKDNPTFLGGTKLICKYLEGSNNEYLKIKSYWNSQQIAVELKSIPSNPHHEEALSLVDKIIETITKEEDPEKIRGLFKI